MTTPTNDSSKDELEVAPLGVCNDCLAKMKGAGKTATRHDLGSGLLLFELYCLENECGALTLAGAGRPIRWNLFRPIDAAEFSGLVWQTVDANQAAQRAKKPPETH